MTPTSGPIPNPISRPARTLTARSPEDILAVVPVVLGFHPQDSIVMLTVGVRGRTRSPGTFHARVDLPPPEHLDEVLAPLRQAADTQGVGTVAFVLYTADTGRAKAANRALRRVFPDRDVLTVLRFDRGRWWEWDRMQEYAGGESDPRHHRFAVEAVLQGEVVLGSREELVDSLSSDVDAVRETEAVLGQVERRVGDPESEAAWVAARVVALVARDVPLAPEDVARLALATTDDGVRNVAWALMTRASAERHLALWREVLRRCPERLVPGVAALTAFAAWLAGHGALAWCAVDRCTELDPEHNLAGLIADLLESAASPAEWDKPRAADPLVS